MNLVFITGGSRGLGAALLAEYRARDWEAVDLSRSGSGANHIVVDLGQLDASMEEVVAAFASRAQSSWEQVVFINNAATITPIGPVHELDDAAIAQNLTVNVTAGIRLISAFVRAFHGTAGRRIVANISSGAAQRGISGWSLYCAAKAGMEHFIQVLAMEQSAQASPILAVNIEPGLVDTAMQHEIRATDQAHFPAVDRFIQYKETGQLRSPEAVAGAIGRILAGQLEQGRRYSAVLDD